MIFYENRENPSTPSQVRYDYTRHGRQLFWDWHNPVTGALDPILGWSHHAGRNQVPDSTFEEFLRHQDHESGRTSPTPAGPSNQ